MQQRLESCHNQPLLMLVNLHDNGTRTVALRSGNETSKFELKLNGFPIYDMAKDCGSSHGCLAYADADANLAVILLNPFTGCTITLPPVLATHGYYIKQVALSVEPSLCPSDFEALVMYYEDSASDKPIKLAHFKSGQDTWTPIKHSGVILSYNMTVYYKGRFLVCSDYYMSLPQFEVFSVDVSSKETKQLRRYRISDFCRQDIGIYLVESSGGDLMVVIREVQSSEDLGVQVFKLMSDFDDGIKCVEIKTIGNDALFLDRNQSICVSALEFPECHPNFIYFDDGTFDLETQNMHRRHNSIPPLSAVWISPTMCFESLNTTDEGHATGKGCRSNS